MRFDRRTVLAITLAVAAAGAVFLATGNPAGESVLVAAADLPSGRPLTPEDVETREVPSSLGLVVRPTDDIVGWSLAVPIDAGEPLLTSLLRSPERRSAPDVIALELDLASAVAGQVRVGDLVDIYLSQAPSGLDEAPTTSLVASSVSVVGLSSHDSFGGTGRISVLLAVDDLLAPVLAGAHHSGNLDLVRLGR